MTRRGEGNMTQHYSVSLDIPPSTAPAAFGTVTTSCQTPDLILSHSISQLQKSQLGMTMLSLLNVYSIF